ncbi:MAG: MCP four helix bundle domain-containing protein [Comamonadaceae bacterium]|nr:MCP four helix bundle domain-containing protein [Comamonadaceae bacterium]
MSNIKIGARLGIAFGIVLLITVAVAAAAVYQLERLKAANAEMVEHDMQRNELTQQWAANVQLNLLQVETVAEEPAQTDVDRTRRNCSQVALEATRDADAGARGSSS